jgi:hypothetical protein
MVGVRDIIGFLVGSTSEVTDEGCVMLREQCATALLQQHPSLSALSSSSASAINAWIEAQPVKTLRIETMR